ncbi:MAG: hypothetical protein QXN36_02320 [Candidatus Bathyarchaeia archaeon]
MAAEQQTQENNQYKEEATSENPQPEQEIEQQEYTETENLQEQRFPKNSKINNVGEDRSSFIHGLAVGLGIGCIATFVITWIAIFFTPMLPSVTYETLLSIFIYPLIYLLAVGLVSLTAGIVREYYARKPRF